MNETKNNVSWALYIILGLIVGFIFGFYFQWLQTNKIKIELDQFKQREVVIRQAELDVQKSLAENTLNPAQIKIAEEDVIKSLSTPNR